MGKQTLGIYLNEEYITAVVTEHSGKTRSLAAFGQLPCEEEGPLATPLDDLLDRLSWSGGEVICGVPLSWISVRNIELPFSDKKNIIQTLPFELDDQLISPVDELVTDFSVLDAGEDKSRILTFTIEKERLHGVLTHLGKYGLEPSTVVPAVVPLASVVGREHNNGQVLYLTADAGAYSLALIKDGVCQFCRNLPFNEQILASLYGDAREPRYKALSASLRRSIGFLRTIGFPPETLHKVCVSGPLIHDDMLCDHLETSLALPLERLSLIETLAVSDQLVVADPVGEYEAALSLSFYHDYSRNEYNLRQGEFALKRTLFRSKKQLAAGGVAVAALLVVFIGYFVLDQKRLAAQNAHLSDQMTQIYREQFPGATRIQDPYVQMQVALRGMEATESDIPIYAGNQRTLDFLADISSRIPEAITLQVSRMVVDNKAVRMRGVTETFNAVDEIKNLLARSPLYTGVQIVSATADKKSQKIRFEIQMDLGEGG